MKASDVMVTDVITVKPNSNVQDVAQLLLANRISAVPVIDDAGKLVGMVSEGDLLRRSEADTKHERAWWLRLLMGPKNLANEYLKEHSRMVADVMTHGIISAEPELPSPTSRRCSNVIESSVCRLSIMARSSVLSAAQTSFKRLPHSAIN